MATLLLPSHAASHCRAVFPGGSRHPLAPTDLLGGAPRAVGSRRHRPIAVACRAATRAKEAASAGPGPQALAKEAHKYFDHAVVSVRAGDGGHGAILNMPPGPSTTDAAPKSRGGRVDKSKGKKGSGKKVSYKRNYDGSVSLPVGGHGGDVVLYAEEAEETLLGFHSKARHCAKRGGNVGSTGTMTSRMHNGSAGETLRIPVPVGTVVRRKKGSVLADLAHPGDEVLVARGGQGGISLIDAPDYKRGKAMALSPNVMRDVTDKVLTHGQPGEEITLELILRVVADVGLVGLPNAGKSTLLSAITLARPDIADYPAMASSSPTPLLLGLLVVLLASARVASVSLPALPLSTASRWVVGADGRRVKLACANWASHLEPVAAEGLSRQGVGDIAARVAAMGFNCVRLTWPTYLATNATLSSLPLRWSLELLGLRESAAGVRVNNPGLLDLPLIDVFREVVSALASNSVMVILDNQMTTPGWCCSRSDGNTFFGDKYFDPEEWLKGLSAMATMFRNTKNVVGMSLRNELRGPYQNVSLWYRYMQQGAEAVHAANPNVLVILSGLDFDNTLSFLFSKQVELSFTGKLVFEQHWYGFSDGTDWDHWNQNDACGVAAKSIRTKGLFLIQQGWPLFFSEIGFDMSGTHTADNRYLTCFLSVAAEMDLDWAVWALQGSYYIREGILAYDETYGLLSWDWSTARNPNFIKRINSLQTPFQGPGLPNSQKPYNVIFHLLTGLCVLVKSVNSLKLGPCDQSNAWNYTSTSELVLKHTGQCLEAKSVGDTAKLGAGCSKSCSKWQLISNSSMHVSTELTKNGTRVCMDAGPDGSITTNQCKCLSEDPYCNPESQWFKVILSSRGIPGEASILQLPSLGPRPATSRSSW